MALVGVPGTLGGRGGVLVPSAELRTQFHIAMRTAQQAGLPKSTLASEAGKSYIARWLTDQFDVSEQEIERRMEKDGLWVPPPVPPGAVHSAKTPRKPR